MRTPSADQEAVLALRYRSTHLRVSIDRGASDWVDITDLEGRNWVVSVEYGGELDNSVADATVMLSRKVENLNLAPLVDGSKLNASGTIVDIGNPIKIEVAITPIDAPPRSGDWVEIFRGEIDQVEWERSPIKLLCRDEGGLLEDRFIETQQKRPSAAATDDVEDIMQEILDGTLGGGTVTLWSPNGVGGGGEFDGGDSPGWVINEYYQRKQTLMQALRVLADQIGWHVRYKWQTNAAAFKLQFYDPGREISARGTMNFTGQPAVGNSFDLNVTTIDCVAGAPAVDEFNVGSTVAETCGNIVDAINDGTEGSNAFAWYEDENGTVNRVVVEWLTRGTVGNNINFVDNLNNCTFDGIGKLGGTVAGVSISSMRTFTPSQYYDISKLSIARSTIRNVIQVKYGRYEQYRSYSIASDSASITKYGRRFMEIAENASSQIDTASEAMTLANSVLDDLKEPTAEQSITMPYFWPVELGDYYTFDANDVHYDSAQDLAIVAYRHSLTKDRCRTTLTCRGKPAGGVKRWLLNEARPGVGGENDFLTDEAVENVSVGANVGGLVIEYDDPRSMSPPIADWAYTRVHLSTSWPFTADDSNLYARGRQTRFEISNLSLGTKYYAKLYIVDFDGNVGAVYEYSTGLTTHYSSPYYNDPNTEHIGSNPNRDFGAATLDIGTYPPDWWTVTEDSWTGEVDEDTTNTLTGGRSIKMTNVAYNVSLTGGPNLQFTTVAGNNNDTVVRAAGSFVTDGFRPGMWFIVSNTVLNNFAFQAQTVTANTVTIYDDQGATSGFATEGPVAGDMDAGLREISSDFIVVEEGDLYKTQWIYTITGVGGNNIYVSVYVDWYNKNKAQLSPPNDTTLLWASYNGSDGPIVDGLGNSWYRYRRYGIEPPQDARYAKIKFLYSTIALDADVLYLDSFSFERDTPRFRMEMTSGGTAVAAGGWRTYGVAASIATFLTPGYIPAPPSTGLTAYYDYGTNCDTSGANGQFTAPAGGTYSFVISGRLTGMAGAGAQFKTRIYVNGATAYPSPSHLIDGIGIGDHFSDTFMVDLASGDTVVAQIYHNGVGGGIQIAENAFIGQLFNKKNV